MGDRIWKVTAANLYAAYSAGVFAAASAAEACEKARENYRRSSLGSTLKDVGGFRFSAVEVTGRCECEED